MTTPANNPARAATVGELAKFRASGQSSEFGIVIHKPVTVYSARINQTFTTVDGIDQLTYDTGSGTLSKVLQGMVIFIGSTAGARDKGIAVVRKTPTSTTLYIRPVSGISFADNDYLTVIDSILITGRPIYNSGDTIRMDSDIEYGSLTRGGAIVRCGPIASVIEQSAGTITFTPPNPSLSAAYDGATISSFLFDAPNASSTSNMTSATDASWTYPLSADGQYSWSCRVTDSLGRNSFGYRRVFVNPSEIPFKLEQPPTGNISTGDWSFQVTAYADVDTLFEGAMVVLYRKDYHSGVLGSIGKIDGYENIEVVGWIDGEIVEQNDQSGWYTFTVYGPAHWLAKTVIDPFSILSTTAPATAWNEVQNLTVDKALSLVLYWMTTCTLVMDCFFTGDTKKLRNITINGSTVWDAIRTISGDTIFATFGCNNYGQLFVSIDPQMAESSARSAYPVVMDITSDDFEGRLELIRKTVDKSSRVQLSAFTSFNGRDDTMVHSRAPGNFFGLYGELPTYQDYIVADSADCRRLSGRLLAVDNNEFEPIVLTFPSSNLLFDIVPPMIATISTDSSSNPRGTSLVAARLIPRTVMRTIENGAPKSEVTFEVEVTGVDGVDYFPPISEEPNLDLALDDFSGVDFPAIDEIFPETVPLEVSTPCNSSVGNYFTLTWSPRTLTGSTSLLISHAYFPCMIRATGGTAGDTHIRIQYTLFGDAVSHLTCYAVKDGTRVLTGVWDGDTITFSPLSDTEISGFEIELDAGAGTVIDRFELGSLVETGVVGSTTTQCIPFNYYAIAPYKGYWTATYPPSIVGLKFYNTKIAPSNEFYNAGNGRDGWGVYHTSSSGQLYAAPYSPTDVFNVSTGQFEYYEGNYGMIFFKSINFPGDQKTLNPSATGALGVTGHDFEWVLYEAKAIGRQIVIGYSTLHNVCKIEA